MVSTSQPIRWGILGTGVIAKKFAEGLRTIPDAVLWAVGSRTLSSAQDFARQFEIPQVYGSYFELVNDPAIDVVYIATPHTRHKDDCILCLNAGKAVLCEKPFVVNAQEARDVIDLARQRNLFCMEAMWMRFMPLIQKVKNLVESGAIGKIYLLTADFGYQTEFDPNNRFFNPELGGGALLDRGVYPLSLAFFLLGTPTSISSQACFGETGVDEQSTMVLKYDNDALAVLFSTLRTHTSNTATIWGSLGKICIHEPFYQPGRISITKFSDISLSPVPTSNRAGSLLDWKRSLITIVKRSPVLKRLASQLRNRFVNQNPPGTTMLSQTLEGNGFNYEAAEVMRCLRNGERESQVMPLDETLKIMAAMDTIRHQWNFKYPHE